MSDQEQDTVVLPFDDGSTGRVIRSEWHDGQWFFSVIDVVAVLTDTDSPRRYWSDLKRKLRDEGFELYEKIVQLKLRSPLDGKKYPTDAADTETMLRIVQSIPSPKVEPIKQWLAHVGSQKLEEAIAERNEDQRRLLLRGEVATQNRSLAATAGGSGIVSTRDFAIFQDWGYMGLYDGETSDEIAARKGLAKGQAILDHMGSTELAANLFRITQTDDRLRAMQEEGTVTKTQANTTHFQVGQIVRKAIGEIGGTMPEDLPTPPESIAELERKEQQKVVEKLQPSLFGEGEGEEEPN